MSSTLSFTEYDVVIVGGGLIGASLLCALKTINTSKPLKIALIEPKDLVQDNSNSKAVNILDERSLVLNLGSKLYYEKLGVWDKLKSHTTPINKIIVSEQGSFSKVFLDQRKLQVDALGYVVNIDRLNHNLWQYLDIANIAANCDHQIDLISPYKVNDLIINANNVELLLTAVNDHNQTEKITGKIIIGADGGRSYIRDLLGITYAKHDYKQSAVIANLSHELANNNTAYERFSQQGPCALLPRVSSNASHYFSGVVWPWPNDHLDYVKSLPKHELLTKLQNLFGYKLGKFLDLGELQCFPLWRVTSDRLFKNRVLLMGNAANHLHPIGGQGFNLGLRDIKCFHKLLSSNIHNLINNDFNINYLEQMYDDYVNYRLDDHRSMQNSTHQLLDLFASNNKFIKAGRKIGMSVCNHSNLLTSLIADQSMGLNV